MTSIADIFSTLIAHRMILNQGMRNKPTSGSSNMALIAKIVNACTNPNCSERLTLLPIAIGLGEEKKVISGKGPEQTLSPQTRTASSTSYCPL